MQPVAHHHHLHSDRHVGEAGERNGRLDERPRCFCLADSDLIACNLGERNVIYGCCSGCCWSNTVLLKTRGRKARQVVERCGGRTLHSPIGGVRSDRKLAMVPEIGDTVLFTAYRALDKMY